MISRWKCDKIRCFNYEDDQCYVQSNKHYKLKLENLNNWHKFLIDDKHNSNVCSNHIRFKFKIMTFNDDKKNFNDEKFTTTIKTIKTTNFSKKSLKQLIQLQMIFMIHKMNKNSFRRSFFKRFSIFCRHWRKTKKFNFNNISDSVRSIISITSKFKIKFILLSQINIVTTQQKKSSAVCVCK